jgi:SAM-dependent methyltransferase
MDMRGSYDAAASAYAEHLFDELNGKPLDRHLLDRFAEEVREKGIVADLGCGPGQIAKYLHDAGANVVGIDLSPEMIRVARSLTPGVEFKVSDMTSLDFGDASLAGAVSFYSIVHFEPSQLEHVFSECARAIQPGGLFLVAFHIGDDVKHVDDLWGVNVSLDFRFHDPSYVKSALTTSGFTVIEATERKPYPGAEHQSRRCYLLAKRC